MTDKLITQRTLYSGRVQGVGFRWTVEKRARGLPVTGFVRKLSDGRVELVARGTAASLESLHAAISKHVAGGADTENLGTHHAANSRNHVAGHPIKDRPSNATRGQAGGGYGLEPSVYY